MTYIILSSWVIFLSGTIKKANGVFESINSIQYLLGLDYAGTVFVYIRNMKVSKIQFLPAESLLSIMQELKNRPTKMYKIKFTDTTFLRYNVTLYFLPY